MLRLANNSGCYLRPGVSEQVLHDPQAETSRTKSPDEPAGQAGPGARAVALIRRYPWPFGAIGLLILAALIVHWSRTRPGYDPYGWLVWGKLTIHWKLDTNGAPSWKPLPFLFTVPFAGLGNIAIRLWMITAVAISLSAGVFAWRIAWRLVDAPPESPLRRLCRGPGRRRRGVRHRPVLALRAQRRVGPDDRRPVPRGDRLLPVRPPAVGARLLVLGSLGRPEVWPFLGLYAVWAWRKHPLDATR